jgi:flagellar motor switch/type III secretory pathway protein FliN
MNQEKERLAYLGNVAVEVCCEAARKLAVGSVIEFYKLAGEAFEIRLNGHLFAEGEVVVVTDLMAVRVTSLTLYPEEVS